MGKSISMFKTEPFVSEKVWGYERWILSTHKAGESVVAAGTEFISAKPLSSIVGADYPLLVKIIQANETLSVQVHPDDDYAGRVENSRGKTECWYILDATANATLICGLSGDSANYSQKELARAIEENRLEDCLQRVPVTTGDFIFIPAGTVHAIEGGLRLLEVQQSSDITYRLYDWGRPREIHVEKSLDVIKAGASDVVHSFTGRYACDYFTLEKLDYSHKGVICLAKEVIPNTGANRGAPAHIGAFDTPAFYTQWASLVIISGEGSLTSSTGESVHVCAEDCIMIRTDEEISVQPKGSLPLSIMKIG